MLQFADAQGKKWLQGQRDLTHYPTNFWTQPTSSLEQGHALITRSQPKKDFQATLLLSEKGMRISKNNPEKSTK